jgi:small GTP-binding protein|tara:strand:- start:24 stop:572 length:549 start_codon:yes stop_codon:yes gene_type:complete
MQYKVVIVGDVNTGKTSLLNQYVFSTFQVSVPTTIGVEFCHKELGNETNLCLWDTAGQERFRAVNAHFYRGAHAVIFVYDVSSMASFDSLGRWWRQYCSYGDRNKSVAMLVGNKTDLRRQVTREKATAWAVEKGLLYEELSAKQHEPVNAMFASVVRLLRQMPVAHSKQPYKYKEKSDRCCY